MKIRREKNKFRPISICIETDKERKQFIEILRLADKARAAQSISDSTSYTGSICLQLLKVLDGFEDSLSLKID